LSTPSRSGGELSRDFLVDAVPGLGGSNWVRESILQNAFTDGIEHKA
jgi:hypothetical protein